MRIQFSINNRKAIEVILWILHRDNTIDLYRLMKVLFHADWSSVNKYGSPITGDNYLAMPYGTVPDTIYNRLIKKDAMYLEDAQLEEKSLPFDLIGNNLIPKRLPNIDEYLSIADIECLELGVIEYAGLSFEEVKNKNHSIKAWQETYQKTPNSFIDWYDLIEEQYLKDDLSDGWANHMVI
ncbi:Putative SocA family antitoxin (plasmid) [Candidatus Megaera polyxenophila]|nr:Putative SocA family antitoxin [Candidatus Megaera polyxenophila]